MPRRARPAAAGLALLAVLASVAAGQQPRPWLSWRTVETEHFVFHFPEQYRAWTLDLASRMEDVRTRVGALVGFLPEERVHFVVDDPVSDGNGTAYTALDAPTIVLWPTPPTPRDEIGNFRVWNELVATHEFAHVAHLTRPSRNHWKNLLWALSPVPLGPIAVEAPRWVLEGYATYVEGRASGSGRPNHAWRAAILRQFAIEGRLPSYAVLSATGGWETGSFAYLAGSAYLEWLARHEGDASIVALWRRLTAKTARSFDDAFSGVYGASPAQLYGRFVAEVTADALAFERALDVDAAVPGTLVQRLARNTGDPAISPDGNFLAIAIRHRDAPGELVVWRTADEPDTAATRRRELQLRRDPDDVPDRTFYPPPRRVIISLMAADGAPYESPRWLSDNRHLLVTRRMPMSDGSLRSDLFLWSAEDGTLSRITHGAAIRNADPSPDGTWAAAVRCDHGWCDLVRVDLATGAVRMILSGDVMRNFDRPRVSRTTGEIVVAEQRGDRWRIARVNAADATLRYADPDDGVTRFDAAYGTDGRTIIVTSEAGGIANLERLNADSRATRLTAVTGAAVGADVAPDGTLWFLSLHADGYDLRRIKPDSESIARAARAAAPSALALADSLSPVLPPMRRSVDSTGRSTVGAVSEETAYGTGPDRLRYVPAAVTSYGGSSVLLSLVRTDPVGRVQVVLLGAAGSAALPEGASLALAARASRTEFFANAWATHEAPSHVFSPGPDVLLDMSRAGGAMRIRRSIASDGGDFSVSLGGLLEHQIPNLLPSANRSAALFGLNVVRRQRDVDSRYQEQLVTLAELGNTDGGGYLRQRSTVALAFGGNTGSLTTARISYGTIGGGGGAMRERFAIGGLASSLIDPALDARRVDAPAYPFASVVGNSFSAYRVGVPVPPVEIFYTAASPDLFKTALRSYGVELRERVQGIAALGTPDVDVTAGFARAVDAPVAREWRYYVAVAIRP